MKPKNASNSKTDGKHVWLQLTSPLWLEIDRMRLHKVLAIGRAERFSPNSVEKDAAILASVCDELTQMGCKVETVGENDFAAAADRTEMSWQLCLTMGRSRQLLSILHEMESNGCTVVNSSESVEVCCNRRKLNTILQNAGVTLPPDNGRHGWWLKRADGVAEGPGDVRFAADEIEKNAHLEDMRRSGITDILVSAHLPGDLLKFYGVRQTGFFRFYYPGDDGQWKFGDESRNGIPRHYRFDTRMLYDMAEKAAKATGTDVYGGDCIVQENGTISVIDFNDWPSFARCRNEAAKAIAQMAVQRMEYRNTQDCEKEY